MVSLAYNVGVAAFARSTVLKAHNSGDFEAASRAFGLWNKARVNGALTELKGLTRRRAAESSLYLRDESQDRMPQAVEGESNLSKSPIQQSGVVTAATGVGTVMAAMVDGFGEQVKRVGEIATSVGVQPVLVIGFTLAIAGGTAIYYRMRQRKGGWA
jgi:lysozyme